MVEKRVVSDPLESLVASHAEMKGKRALSLAIAAVALGVSASAEAFSVEGHEALEAVMWRGLLEERGIEGPHGEHIDGIDVVRFLIRRGALDTPPCFEPRTKVERAKCEVARVERPLVFWPIIGSGEPDLKSSRQFGTNGQCFHFMARSEHVWSSEPDGVLPVPRKLVEDAYVRCTRALGELFRETVLDPVGANADYRGLYAMLHTVADSFSAAHVERDADWKILYLKPWRLRAFLPYAVPGRWGAYQYLVGPSHHGVLDERDGEFIKDEPECHVGTHPYAVPASCLTPRGSRAAQAMRDLVVTVYRTISAGSHDPDSAFEGFVERNLKSARMAPDVRPPFWDEREWTPAFAFGFRFRPNAVPGATDMSLVAATTVVTDVTLPLSPLFSIEGGCRRIASRCHPIVGVDASLLIPLTDGFSLGVTPFSLIGQTDSGGDVSVGAHVLRADLFFLDSIWLGVAGPKYDSLKRAFDRELVAVSLGVAWSGRLSALRPIRLELPRVDVPDDDRDAAPGMPAAHRRGEWELPDLGGNYRRERTTVVIHVLGGTVLPEQDRGSYSVGGVEVLWDRDRWNRRAGFAIGARMDSEYRTVDPDRFFTVLGGPVARAYLVPNRLALEVAPAQFDGGWHAGKVVGEGFFDVGAEASIAVMPLNRLEIGLESPRLSYKQPGRVAGTNLGIRVGFAVR